MDVTDPDHREICRLQDLCDNVPNDEGSDYTTYDPISVRDVELSLQTGKKEQK